MKIRECEINFPKSLNLTNFQQLLIVQMLRPDRLHTSMCNCALNLAGKC